MENVRELLNELNRYSVVDANAINRKVLLQNDMEVTYHVRNNLHNKDMVFQAVLVISYKNSEPITWGCTTNEDNYEVVRWFERKDAGMLKKKTRERDTDTQILASLIDVSKL
tara:strand:+ start:1090 stop:1425 length:336 start_codon:yes stop_codon:yes gene_type:complete